MNSASVRWSLIVCFLSCSAWGQEEKGTWTHPDTSGPEWHDVFAADLSNAVQSEGAHVWSWKDGVLTASEDKGLWTNKDYENFILDLEFKNAPGTNSGVIVYVSDLDDWIPNSVEVQITDDFHPKWAKGPTSAQCGAIYGRLGPKKQAVKPAGEWNHYTLYCQGQRIRVVLNGEFVTDLDMALWKDARRNPDGSEIPEWLSRPLAELPTHGRIGLQGKHGDAAIWFRNLKTKEL